MILLHQKFLKISQIALILNMIASVCFTYMGMIEEYGSVDSWSSIRPLLQSMISALIGLIGWWFFTQTIPVAKPQDLKKLCVGLALFVVLIISTSTYYGSIGIAGNQARHEVMNKTIEKAEQTYTKLIRQKREVETLLPVVTGGKNVFMSIVQREKQGGVLSGKGGGRGKVSMTLQGLVDGFERLEETLNSDINKTERLYVKGNRLIEEFRTILNDRTITTSEKYDRIASLYLKFRRLFLDLEKSIIPTFTAQVERLDNMYLITNDDETKKLFAVLQKPIAESKALILETAASLKTRPVSIPSFKIVGSLEAVMMTPAFSYPSLAYAFASDFIFPLGLLMILYYLASGIRNTNKSNGSANKRSRTTPIATMPPQMSYAMKGNQDSNNANADMKTKTDKTNNGNGTKTNGESESKPNGDNGKHLDTPTDF